MTNEFLKSEMVTENKETLQEKFFTTTGRIDRLTFFKRLMMLIGAGFLLTFISAIITIPIEYSLGIQDSMLSNIAMCGVMLATFFPEYCLTTKRLHDIGQDETLAKIFIGIGILELGLTFAAVGTTIYLIAEALSVVSLIFTIYLLFKKGDNNANEYGAAK